MARKVQVCRHRKEDGEYTPIAECAQCRAWQSLLAAHGYDNITQGRPTDGE